MIETITSSDQLSLFDKVESRKKNQQIYRYEIGIRTNLHVEKKES